MRKVAYYLVLGLVYAGGAAVVAAQFFSVWLFWTDSFWAFAKIFGLACVGGIIVALVGSMLLPKLGEN